MMQRRDVLKASTLVLSLGTSEIARGATILAVRIWPATDYSRVTIESDGHLVTRQSLVTDPPRLVVDIQGIDLNPALRQLVAQVKPDDPYIAGIRAGQYTLIYVAPERFRSPRFVDALKSIAPRIALVAIDEAHCISEWGHNFRPEYLRLAGVAEELGLRPVLALTATATPEVAQDICRAFRIAPQRHVQTSFRRKNLIFI
jgi:hypothetical protein